LDTALDKNFMFTCWWHSYLRNTIVIVCYLLTDSW